MKNSLQDLNNILFEQIERLNDDEYMAENGADEKPRALAIAKLAQTLINGSRLQLEALKIVNEYMIEEKEIPETFKSKKSNYFGVKSAS